MRVEELLLEAVRRKASDVLISAGTAVHYHVFGRMERSEDGKILTTEESEDLVYQLLTPLQKKEFEQTLELDLSFHLKDVSRFRVSVLRQKGAVGAVMRLVPLAIPRYTDLGIPERLLLQIVNTPNGLILVTGPTGAGKSSTVAAILNWMNTESEYPKHIITIEDPIEFLFPPRVCVVDQREIGPDTKSYVNGLRSALRQMPHIIFVGEMRDRETMEIALTAAETGNLVISTLSTQSASKTINRIIDVFPIEDQAEIRARLALTLKVIVSQVLLRRQDVEGRVAAREVLFVDSPVANLIREGKIHQVDNVISASGARGMVLLDDSLIELYQQGIVSKADVLSRIQDAEKMRRLG
ncbi:MAG: type IV pilus twitching motility protein PilT [Candidatus Eisenbacteria bacterium]|nr:PilT/PilU family type 4a pilus ATPase [Candidatus Eisenbacteria bacterium]